MQNPAEARRDELERRRKMSEEFSSYRPGSLAPVIAAWRDRPEQPWQSGYGMSELDPGPSAIPPKQDVGDVVGGLAPAAGTLIGTAVGGPAGGALGGAAGKLVSQLLSNGGS